MKDLRKFALLAGVFRRADCLPVVYPRVIDSIEVGRLPSDTAPPSRIA